MNMKKLLLALGLVFATIAVYQLGRYSEREGIDVLAPQAQANETPEHYYPGTEELGANEMRVIACGTGMPTPRPSQAASCWLVELGNGDKFLFDLGSMSSDNVVALGIPYDYLDKVFISHLHTDHFGDLPAFFVGSWLMNRQVPLKVWGPSGPKPEWGTEHAVKHMLEMVRWDLDGRNGRLPPVGREIEVHEFDYRGENEIIYDENGVVIRSFPAIHVIDGPVSYSLEWNGLKFVFGGDTYPNNWFIEYAKGADLAIHEAFIAVPGHDREVRLACGSLARGRHPDPHRAARVWKSHERHRATDGGRVPLLQRLRHRAKHPQWHSADLRRAADPRRRHAGVECHAG